MTDAHAVVESAHGGAPDVFGVSQLSIWRRLTAYPTIVWRDARAHGLMTAAKILLAHALSILAHKGLVRRRQWRWSLNLAPLDFPFLFRPFSSDAHVIRQVISAEEHRPVSALADVRLVVDCGANVGCAAVYLLQKYPVCRLVAVEPDLDNFAVLLANLKPYGARARAVRAAVWPNSAERLNTLRGVFGDGSDWACAVQRPTAGEGDTATITLGDILRDENAPQIDLLKIDIEGAERELLSNDPDQWLRRTRNLCIELHGPEIRTRFETAMRSYRYAHSVAGELDICLDIQAR